MFYYSLEEKECQLSDSLYDYIIYFFLNGIGKNVMLK